MAYENKSNWTLGENKPKQTQFQIGWRKRNKWNDLPRPPDLYYRIEL
jgi:hypothetical protein